MQIRNQEVKYLNNPNFTGKLGQSTDKKVSFSKSEDESNKPPKNSKVTHFIKVWTDKLGITAFVSAIILCSIYSMKRPYGEKMIEKLTKMSKAAKTQEEVTKINNALEKYDEKASSTSSSKFLKLLDPRRIAHRLGIEINKARNMGEELFNNLVYGFGTVVVMPLVILFSPFGAKESSKEDKVFTILRQPLSFILMFSMQLTVDKFLSKMVFPRFMERKVFEYADLYQDEARTKLKTKIIDGKEVMDPEILSRVRFDSEPHKKAFKAEFEKALQEIRDTHVTSEHIPKELESSLLKLKDEGKINETIHHILFDENKYGKVATFLTDRNHPQVQKALSQLENYIKVSNRAMLLKETLVIGTNVLFSVPVGCTALNVAYGKFMKYYGGGLANRALKAEQKKEAKKGGVSHAN